jgi:protein-L-isoaspartate(D-aspartate) O-methyltransferase
VRGDAAARLLDELWPQIGDERVLAAIAAVPREAFVPLSRRHEAYENMPLPIGCGQTISQPLVVARMCELLALRGSERVLDVGTGSGWHAAVLAQLAAEVWSIERHARLSETAGANLAAAQVGGVRLIVGDGSLGLPEHGPYDAINVAAAVPGRVPPELEDQLAPGGRLVAPVEDVDQRLVLVRRDARGALERTALEPVRFVPLVSG